MSEPDWTPRVTKACDEVLDLARSGIMTLRQLENLFNNVGVIYVDRKKAAEYVRQKLSDPQWRPF